MKKKLVIALLALSMFPARVQGMDDSEMLMRIAMAEAEGEDVEGKAMVMRVVLNRVSDERFPGTVEDVLFQKSQFSTVKDGGRYWRLSPDEGCGEALEMIEDGWDETDGALFFTSGSGFKGREFLFEHGGHKFYR